MMAGPSQDSRARHGGGGHLHFTEVFLASRLLYFPVQERSLSERLIHLHMVRQSILFDLINRRTVVASYLYLSACLSAVNLKDCEVSDSAISIFGSRKTSRCSTDGHH
jgi:hypothetical protein